MSKRKKAQNKSSQNEVEVPESTEKPDAITAKELLLENEILKRQEYLVNLISATEKDSSFTSRAIKYLEKSVLHKKSRSDGYDELIKELETILAETEENYTKITTEKLLQSAFEIKMLSEEIRDLSGVQIREAQQLNEAKMLVVGQGEVGKTSLIKKLLDDKFDILEPKTEGINIRRWNLPVDGKDVRINIWDFGGQEIAHATHQFFLTKRSLYLLVIAARKDEYQNNLEYWLKLIQSFGGDSPIIVVVNKTEDGNLDLARRSLQSKYPNLKAFVETSCKTGAGIKDLRNAVSKELANLDLVHDYVDARWIRIKNQLEEMKEDYIEYDKYQQLCVAEGITDLAEQRNLVRFLHDLGTILNFGFSETTQRLDIRLENTNVINPEWVTTGVYAILFSNILYQEGGTIRLEQLGSILDINKYPKDKQVYIIEMMKKFELCFELAEERDKFLVVAGNLPKDEPDLRFWIENNPLKFEFHYNFLPGSVISRFIVRMYQTRIKNLYWRTGIAIKYQENEALVKADLSENIIYIYVTGNPLTRREFLTIIRSEITRINTTIAQLEAREKVPYEGLLLDYEELIDLEKMGETSIALPKLQRRVKIQEILSTVDPKDLRKKGVESMGKNNPWTSGSFYLVAFVIVVAAIGLLAKYTSWIAVPIVLIAALLAISIIGAMQLRNDKELKDESFVKLVMEFYKRLPLLKKGK